MSALNENQIHKNDGSSDLAVDPEKTKEPRRPADLRWKFYKDPSHGGGLRAALLYIYIYIYIYIKIPYINRLPATP